MNLDEKIIKRFDELISVGNDVINSIKPREVGHSHLKSISYIFDQQLLSKWATNSQNLLTKVFNENSEHYKNYTKYVQKLDVLDLRFALGVLEAAKEDYENDYLFDVKKLIEAEVFDDFLEQADHLLSNGYHAPAAVIAGCVLEDGLRKLCDKHNIQLSKNPKLDGMNSELAKIGVYNKLKQKDITAKANIRNYAAHGNWDQFTKEDVDDMIKFIRRFMVEYFS